MQALLKSTALIVILFLFLSGLGYGSGAVIPLRDKGFSTLYVQGRIGSLGQTDLMLDTGSGYVTINELSLSKLREAGEASYVKDIRGVMANGKEQVVPVWRIHRLVIADKCVLNNVEAAVFPGKTREILGLTALKKMAPFTVSMDPPSLALNQCNGKPV